MTEQDADQRTDTTSEEEAATAQATTEATELLAQIGELEDRWRRAVADLDNFRKRAAREAERQLEDERARVIRRWLSVVDNLELALDHAGADADPVVEGVRAVRDQALAILTEYGYPRYDDLGRPFDPELHEAVGTVPAPDSPPGTVVHVVRPRYGDADRLLRPAAVIVATEQR
ncbi:nucleotide exchange factor GrpE [Kribbella pittospori]|uniref:Protein GrpE n=1 Tax=Kribbella pittospori TaxID=722689 RepID=A0A4R0JYG6_9ACTN|nr:nucleotide exchange factor GrpE [Kribbella pittospori]TCC50368.1 nucleotide exchange factor GrpE [Kribbella pittospori]